MMVEQSLTFVIALVVLFVADADPVGDGRAAPRAAGGARGLSGGPRLAARGAWRGDRPVLGRIATPRRDVPPRCPRNGPLPRHERLDP